MTVKMGGNYPLPGEKMDFNHKSDCEKKKIQITLETVILQQDIFL